MKLTLFGTLCLLASAPLASPQETQAPAASPLSTGTRVELAPGATLRESFVHYDAGTGKITVDSRGPAQARGTETTVVFDNLSGAPQYYVFPSNSGDEFAHVLDDASAYVAAQESGVVQSVRFRYVSRAQDPASGGPGATVEISLQNEDFSTGTRTRTSAEVMRETITGLPTGNPTRILGPPPSFASMTLWTLTITPATPVCLGAGNSSLGYSFKHNGRDTFPVFQTDVGSQVFNWYYIYNCGGAPLILVLIGNESIGFEITEYVLYSDSPQVIGSAPAPGYGELSASDAFIDSTPFSETLSCSGATPSLALYQIYLGPALGTPLPSKWGDIWVDVSQPRVIKLLQPHGGGSVAFDLGTIPPDYSLQGTRFTSQGFCGDSPRGVLSNAVQHTTGARCL